MGGCLSCASSPEVGPSASGHQDQNPIGDHLAPEPEVSPLYEGGEVAEELENELTCVRLGPQVTRINDGAFSCCKLIKVQLNEGLQIIGEGAFRGCLALRSLSLPSTVMELGNEAFYCCEKLSEAHLNEGLRVVGELAFYGCTALRSITIPSTVTELGDDVFFNCSNLAKVQLNEGLLTIGACTFLDCTSLQNVTLPSTVMELGAGAFHECSMLTEVQFNEGLQIIGQYAFANCTALQSVTLPSTVTKLGQCTFFGCSNLAEVILLGGKRLLNQDFFARGFSGEEQGLLNQGSLEKILFDEYHHFAFRGCPLRAVKISISLALSERMARLTPERRFSVEERIRGLPCLEFTQDGNIVACFPVVRRVSAENGSDVEDIQDTKNETVKNVYNVLQLIAFHELKGSSIMIELAMWKSRINEDRERADCRVAIPGPAKSLIMEYCGYAGFLRPAMEGS